MKQSIKSDIERLEKKINLLNDKLDRLMEVQGIQLEKTPEIIDREADRKRKYKERQQAAILRKQNVRLQIEKMMEDRRLQHSVGRELRRKFDLKTMPSADRIREYQRTNSAKAFDGLKKNSD